MNRVDFAGKATALFAEAKAILSNPEATAEQLASTEQMIADAKSYQERAAQIKSIESLAVSAQQEADKQQEGELRREKNAVAPAEFKEWPEFLQAVHVANMGQRPDARLVRFTDEGERKERKDMVEGVGASGGFLVPPEFQTQLMAVQAERSLVRPRASVIRMARRGEFAHALLDDAGRWRIPAESVRSVLERWQQSAVDAKEMVDLKK